MTSPLQAGIERTVQMGETHYAMSNGLSFSLTQLELRKFVVIDCTLVPIHVAVHRHFDHLPIG